MLKATLLAVGLGAFLLGGAAASQPVEAGVSIHIGGGKSYHHRHRYRCHVVYKKVRIKHWNRWQHRYVWRWDWRPVRICR